jgi:hypothetical protein
MRHLVKEEVLSECGTITSSDDTEKIVVEGKPMITK